MTQIVQRTRPDGDLLTTLADNTIATIDGSYSTLADPAFLFEIEASGHINNAEVSEVSGGSAGGLSICLIRSDMTAAELDVELTADQLTKEDVGGGEYRAHQRLFEIAKLEVVEDAANDGKTKYRWHLHFKPRSKGGIPIPEGSGWSLVVINRNGAPLTTGAAVNCDRLYQRFAWGGF